MGLNETPKAERIHISLFGRRNVGKSSIINGITNQNIAIVSDVRGTTTDPVYKAMELLPLGPVVIVDTPGLDDEGYLGAMRIEKTIQVMAKTDIAILVVDCIDGYTDFEKNLVDEARDRKIPCVIAVNKIDEAKEDLEKLKNNIEKESGYPVVLVSAKDKIGMDVLKEEITKVVPKEDDNVIVSDLLSKGDMVLLVIPIDESAPKGRLILPQQQTIRDIIEKHGTVMIVQPSELKEVMNQLKKKPKMVITDSQAFEEVAEMVPNDIELTSFSILFARYKGELRIFLEGTKAVEELEDYDKILVCEGCTHHRQCNDIGTVKLPKWLLKYTNKKLQFTFVNGTEFPNDLSAFKMIIHCGACMLNEKEMKHRIKLTVNKQIPIVNYGMLISYMKGILPRTIAPFIDDKK